MPASGAPVADLATVLAEELRRLDPQTTGCEEKGRQLAVVASEWLIRPETPVGPVEHSCQWCEINLNHPRCPENADELEDVCPSCGSDPEDITCHAEVCERLGTCGSLGPPWRDRPWHPEPERWTSEWWSEHLRAEHAS